MVLGIQILWQKNQERRSQESSFGGWEKQERQLRHIMEVRKKHTQHCNSYSARQCSEADPGVLTTAEMKNCHTFSEFRRRCPFALTATGHLSLCLKIKHRAFGENKKKPLHFFFFEKEQNLIFSYRNGHVCKWNLNKKDTYSKVLRINVVILKGKRAPAQVLTKA